jgi:hypothetical protein
MIIEDLTINYKCRNCGKTLKVSTVNREMTFDEMRHAIGMTQCVNCKRQGMVDATHIKCELSNKSLATFRYVVRCNLCHIVWSDTFILGGKNKLIDIRTYIKEDMTCGRPSCASRNFSLLSCKRIE